MSSQVVGGYVTHGVAESLPPDAYTYSDTGMFLDPATGIRDYAAVDSKMSAKTI